VRLEVPGVLVGHWTDTTAATGCTVVRFPEGTVASGEVRGGAPATREFSLLEPHRIVARLDALVLAGGSAFGLAAADGVVGRLERLGQGFPTVAGPVPIVVAMALFDLAVGQASVRPGPQQGSRAFDAARERFSVGRVGAGAGATVGTWRGARRSSGLGAHVLRAGNLVVAALVAVNAAGEIDDGRTVTQILDGTFDRWPKPAAEPFGAGPDGAGENTTIGVIVTNGAFDKTACLLLAQSGHDGLARALVPAHARSDGDALVAAATGAVEASIDVARVLAMLAVEQAVRSGGSRSRRSRPSR
jgi:L-aminopeptidase/D-esterase-like protein